MSIIVVEHLSKTYRVAKKNAGLKATLKHFFARDYRYIQAVKDISFTIEPGECVGFLGANGAGKTTALKMLTGLIHPTDGQVKVLGYNPFDRKADFLRQITLVMGQKQQLIWDLPAVDSLRINASVYGIDNQTYRRRLDELKEMLDLEEELTQPVRKLSLGQRMKVELLAALLHHPKVLFLDEPTLGLDINAQAAVRQFLKDYNQQYQATMLLTSHYMADITALCPRVLLIHDGGIHYDGSLSGVVDQFAPYRQVKVDLENQPTLEQMSRYGKVESLQGHVVQLMVKREALTRVVSQLLSDFNVTDLVVTDPPIEKIMGKIFKGGT